MTMATKKSQAPTIDPNDVRRITYTEIDLFDVPRINPAIQVGPDHIAKETWIRGLTAIKIYRGSIDGDPIWTGRGSALVFSDVLTDKDKEFLIALVERSIDV